jgi:sugar (pentulose or hexulose) kinase
MEELFKLINPKNIYDKTGIQFLQFNTIYQLHEHVKEQKEIVEKTKVFLMVPHYLNFLLSGEKVVEYTNATSTQLVNVHENSWDEDLLYITGLNKDKFPEIVKPGTWSLMGIESKKPICSEEAVPFKSLINPNNSRLLNPENMIEEIKPYYLETNQTVPEIPGEIARFIFESLAFQYRQVLTELRDMKKEAINKIHIIGGGAQNKLLNQLCADFTGCEVFAGPVEATAIGNFKQQQVCRNKNV